MLKCAEYIAVNMPEAQILAHVFFGNCLPKVLPRSLARIA
jgi:hypothetical protein